MATDAERAALAEHLGRLPTPELVDVLARVLPSTREVDEHGHVLLTLAQVVWVRSAAHRGAVDALDVELVAWPDRAYHNGGFGDVELSESGVCPSCGGALSSTAKAAFCPVCGTRCALS